MPTAQDPARLWRALISLDGLAGGDAFGERFFAFSRTGAQRRFEKRTLPEAKRDVWRFTDDTLMALSIVEILRRYGSLEQDSLAESFVAHYDPGRGYGSGMHSLLRALRAGQASGPVLTPAHVTGQCSYSNGAALR